MNSAPSLYHQTVSRRIQFQLYTEIELAELGQVFDAPVDVQLSEHDIVQPDLVIVSKQRRHILTPTKIKGVPDLIVEILSPSDPDRRRKRKRSTTSTSWSRVLDRRYGRTFDFATGARRRCLPERSHRDRCR